MDKRVVPADGQRGLHGNIGRGVVALVVIAA